jgi:hypothetical protein
MEAAILLSRLEGAIRQAWLAHGIHVRRQENPLAEFTRGSVVRQQVGSALKNLTKFDIEPPSNRGCGEKLGHSLLAGACISPGQESGIHTWERDQFAEELGRWCRWRHFRGKF